MGLAITLQHYLDDRGIDYEVVRHEPTLCASRSAQASHIPGGRLAKAVILKHETGYMMAVVSANDHIRLGKLARDLNRPVGLATEAEVGEIFADCRLGAVPPVGAAYHLDMVVDETLDGEPDIYFEGGDHESLGHVSAAQFQALTAGAKRGDFAQHD